MLGWVNAIGAQTRTKSTALRKRLNKNNRAALGRRAGRIRLFPAVGLALTAGLIVAFAAYGFLRWITPVDTAKAAAEIDVTRVALTVVAGVGGVVALVIAYRRQRDLEQSRFVERFGAAAAQLGATDVAVRIAGVYAMAGVADESDGPRRQQCVDVLCGYLRLPYSPELGGNHQSKLVLKHHRATADGTRADDEERHLEYRHNDREVRATIVRVIVDRLRAEAEHSWSTSDFDFRTANLEHVDFSKTTFAGAARFNEATFSGDATFDQATFAGAASFNKTTFGDCASFGHAWFNDTVSFREAAFGGDARFGEATFAGAAGFDKAVFSGAAWFGKTGFGGVAGFGAVSFSGAAAFRAATFGGDARFIDVTFSRDVSFGEATFDRNAWFGAATFVGDAKFDAVTFCGFGLFDGATFSYDTSFRSVTFAQDASFKAATFGQDTWFGGAAFSGDTSFSEATFGRESSFSRVAFAARCSFERAGFGAGRVIFTAPRQWGPPSPDFDWADDGAGKPTNVEPADWPPVVPAS